jgi:tape measure domain-containing protein
MYLGQKVMDLGRAFLDAIVQGDQMKRGLTAIYGSATVAATQIDFLRKASSEAGVSFGSLGAEFVKFSASMHSANVPLEQSNNLFKAVTQASATLGLGAEATAGSLNALGQMASKGVVSMEELRQQLGDRLPGVMGITAKAFGITEAQLNSLIASGQLATRDFIVPFTNGLNTMKGETDGLVPAWERFKGVLSEVSQGMGDAGATKILTEAMKVLGGIVGYVALGLSTVAEAMFLTGSAAVALAARLSGDKKAWDFFNEQVEKSTDRLTKQANALNKLIDPTTAADAALTKLAVVLSASAASGLKAIESNDGIGASAKLAAAESRILADTTLDLGAKVVQYNVLAEAAMKQQNAQTEAYSKLAKAAKTHGDSMIANARLMGDQAVLAKASSDASEMEVAATAKLVASLQEETNILVAQKKFIEENNAAKKISKEVTEAETAAKTKMITTTTAELEQATQQLAALKAEAAARATAVEALKDNSAKVGDYKAAMELAIVVLKEYEQLALNGKKTDAEVAAARAEVARNTLLYKDAVNDLITKLDMEAKAKTNSLSMALELAKTAEQHNLILAKQARAIGDNALALNYEYNAKQEAIKIMKLEMQIRALEIEMSIKTAELKRAEITGLDDESVKKRKLIDLEIELLKVKAVANDRGKELIDGLEREAAAILTSTNARNDANQSRASSVASINSETSAIEANITALEKKRALEERIAAEERKRKGVDEQGFAADSKGNRIVAGSDLTTRTGILAFLKSAGVTDDAAAKKITNEFADSNGNIGYLASAGQMKYGGAGSTISQALLKAAEQYTFSAMTPTNVTANNGVGNAVGAPAPLVANNGVSNAVTQTGGSTVVVNIGGVSKAISVSSPADSATLVSILSQLGNAATRSA